VPGVETATQLLHRLTSYEPGREWTDVPDHPLAVQFETNDLDRLPGFYKQYADDLPTVALPRDLPPTTPEAVTVLAGTAHVAPRALELAQLSRILHLCSGVVRTSERPYATWLFRAAGSAGGRFPLELYVAIPAGHGDLPAGVHWYHPQAHALVQVGPPPADGVPTVVVTGVPWRTGWRYRERGYRHIYWDAGTMLAQLLAASGSAGIAAQLYSRFPDAAVTSLVGADGVHEWPVAVVALDDGPPAITPGGPATPGAVSSELVEFPLITAAQRAGDVDDLGSPWDCGPAVEPPATGNRPVEDVILARGSQRRMDPTRGLSTEVARTSLSVALRGSPLPHWAVVHDVAEMAPGVWRVLGPPHDPGVALAHSVHLGPMRDELYRICLEQSLGRDAAFVVIGATDIGALDDRGYREAQLGAGIVEGRLHLLAYALGAAASGMTFLDSEIPTLLGEHVDALLFTCVGVPDYTSTPGGPPGAPTSVGVMQPRD
jgi:hypothetical protein